MRSLVVLALICLALNSPVNGDDYGTYPTAYPFEVNDYGADLLVLPDTGKPEFTYDDKDTGGYFLYGGIKSTFDTQDGPVFTSIGTGETYFYFCQHLGSKFFNVNFWEYDIATWNCTAAGNFYEQADFTGKQNGETVCEECCTDYMGHAIFGDDTLVRQQLFADFVSANGCDTMDETTYCITGDSWHWVCLDGYVTREDRLFVKPCYDGFVMHMMTCAVVKAAGAHSYLEAISVEPQSYIDMLSPTETMIIYSIEYTTMDRVCHPYTYYYPDADMGDSDSDKSGSTVPTVLLSLVGFLSYM
jgi:hypothetical protein